MLLNGIFKNRNEDTDLQKKKKCTDQNLSWGRGRQKIVCKE